MQYMFVFLWKCYFKNRAAKFLCLPHGKKISTGILRMLKGLSIPGRAFDFIRFHFFFLCPLSLSFLSHWLCDRVSNLFIYFHSWLSSFPLWCTGYCHPSENRTAATKKKLFILKGSWHRTNKSVSVHTMYLCHPSSSFFFPFLIQVTGFFFEMKADIIFPVRPECLWNLPCCCSLITCTLPTPW